VIARSEPQELDHAGGRRVVAMNDAVGDAQTHDQESAIGDQKPLETAIGRKHKRPNAPLSSASDHRFLVADSWPTYIKYCCAMAVPS
jgi:hypothetical protein